MSFPTGALSAWTAIVMAVGTSSVRGRLRAAKITNSCRTQIHQVAQHLSLDKLTAYACATSFAGLQEKQCLRLC